MEAATAVLAVLYGLARLARTRSRVPGIVSPTLNVGLIKGGINTNVVPDQVVFRIDRRMVPEEDLVKVEADLRALIAAAAKACPQIKVEVRRTLAGGAADPAARFGGLRRRSSVTPRQSWASTWR